MAFNNIQAREYNGMLIVQSTGDVFNESSFHYNSSTFSLRVKIKGDG